MTITAEQLDEWRKLADDATEGPWIVGKHTKILCAANYVVATVPSGVHERRANKLLITVARTAIPALISEVERLREALRHLLRTVEEFHEFCNEPNRPCGQYGAECPISMGEWVDEDDLHAVAAARAALSEETAT